MFKYTGRTNLYRNRGQIVISNIQYKQWGKKSNPVLVLFSIK